MIEFSQLQLRRGSEVLLDQVSLAVHAGQKVGLVGANGVGKSSLFQLILGQLEADAGELTLPRNWRVAHMAQEVAGSERPALEFVLDGDTGLREIQARLQRAETQEDFHALGELHAALDAAGGASAQSRAERLMLGLGFSMPELTRPVNHFSGGWRIRLSLAQTLMCPSDLLLLDEPTNHLDLDAILWFQNWLRAYPGTLLLVSHDREFLDTIATTIVHMHACTLTAYSGNYSAFESLRAARLAQQQASHQKQQRAIRHMQSFVDRFRYKASKARQAQSRIKAMQRMETIAAAHIDSPFTFSIPEAERSSDPLLTLDDASLGYGQTRVLGGVTLSLHPGDRLGLLGPNGAGKSTLVKTLAGELALAAGTRVEGTHLRIGYFSQLQLDALDLGASALTHLRRLDASVREQNLRNFLGGFGFSGDKTQAPVATFSGGEKARLALALIAWRKPNLLLLDEPTNHLDIDMRQALTEALQAYAGAMVLVSHDRHLLRNTVDEFALVHGSRMRAFDADLEDYAAWLDGAGEAAAPPAAPCTEPALPRADRKVLHSARMEVAAVERRLTRLQRKLAEVETRLTDSALYQNGGGGGLQDLLRERVSLQEAIGLAESEWLDSSAALETLQGS